MHVSWESLPPYNKDIFASHVSGTFTMLPKSIENGNFTENNREYS